MKAHLPAIGVVLFFQLGVFTTSAQSLSIRATASKTTQITWSSNAAGIILEETSVLGSSAVWRPVTEPPLLANNQYSVTLDATGSARFFRLHMSALASITDSSPVDGETGVAVTRETIVYFSQPLADTTVLTATNFYATFGGRRILSRAELATDRRKAALFYLEPLPGSARVNVFFDGEGLKDFLGRPLDPAGTGQANGFKLIQFDTLSLTPLAGTAVIGRVFASELVPGPDTGTNAVNKPLAGVTITVDGMEQTLRTVTDVQGNFTLSPVPPGRFFVHIDGRTVMDPVAGIHYPDQSYYPFVGKAWDAVAGKTNNLAGGTGEIYLPLITPGTLQPVSLTQGTSISFPASVVAANPALAGVTITVPANSLFSDDGTRGGKVGIAPVPPDRLPGPLPPGLEMPLVITVQTDGALNFDTPAPICFPNSRGRPPGEKTSLVSFNHKKGIWEAVGSMTVSADGNLVCTDPGVGILQPGWHGDCGCKPAGPPPPPSACDADGSGLAAAKLKPPPCNPPPCDADGKGFLACAKRCQTAVEACVESCNSYYDEAKDHCGKTNPKCLGSLIPILFQCKTECQKTVNECYNNCQKQFPPCPGGGPKALNAVSEVGLASLQNVAELGQGVQAGAALPPAADPVLDQIHELYHQITTLIYPYAVARTEQLPQEIQTQVDALQAQADNLAGGDAAQYNRDALFRSDEALAAIEASIGEDSGNAPSYPILYLAEILRPAGELQLRGETGPRGQYTLFVPRDGKLVSVSFYDPRTKSYGIVFPHVRPNPSYLLPRFNLSPVDSTFSDFDKDGLSDVVELVYGTDLAKADSDGDGIPDGAEVDQGTNPLDGLSVQTGVIATTKTPGSAVDVWAGNDLVVTAEGTAGVSVFNAYSGANLTILAQLSTPGNAQRVAGSGNFLAVAAGQAGLVILDLSTPAEARLRYQLPLSGAQAVAADAGTAYVGTDSGLVAAVDLVTGTWRNQISVANAVWDLALAGDYLYAVTDNRLLAISLAEGGFELAGSANAPVGAFPYRRLFVGGGIAYATHRSGYHTFDLADPARPLLLAFRNTTQFGWRQIVSNGSGLGVAAVGPNSTDDGPHDVSLYDVSDPRTNDVFLTTFVTPGLARAVAIDNGLAYVADDAAGLDVVNYQTYDARGVPPTIALATSFPTNAPVEMSPVRVTANTSDDVQVRNVEFYLDGVKVFSDGNFPFEYRFNMPGLGPTRTNLVLRARAFDTGGNAAWSDELIVALMPDSTPPRVTKSEPIVGAKRVSTLFVYFSELMDPATLNAASFQLVSAGTDNRLGTADDVPVSGGAVSYRADARAGSLNFALPLPDGLYGALLTTNVADLAGNRLGAVYAWQFRVADAVFWIIESDGLWNDPSNWSTGAVPGPADNVVIDVASADLTITHASGSNVIRSLVVSERLNLTEGTLHVLGASQFSQNVTLSGGTLKGASVAQSGTAKLIFTGHPGNTLDGVSVQGDVNLPPSSRVRIRNGLALTGVVLVDNGVIEFAGDQTFNAGNIVFTGNSGFLDIGFNTTLTLGPAAVVRGKTGSLRPLGNTTSRLINQGLISADVSGGFLFVGPGQLENAGTMESKNGSSLTIDSPNWSSAGRIDANSGALTLNGNWTNTGTINATNTTVNLGGTFTLPNLGTFNRTGGTVNLTGWLDLNGGTLTLDAATGPWTFLDGTIKGGTVTESGAKMAFTGHPGNTLDGVSVNGDLELTRDGRLRVRNGLTLTGSVLVDSGAAIDFAGDQTFNTSSIVFTGTSGFLDIESNTTLTLGPAMVARGKTASIRQSGATSRLINQGLISADVAGATLFISGGPFDNAGTVAAVAAGSSVVITANPFTNTGTIQELNGGKVLVNP